MRKETRERQWAFNGLGCKLHKFKDQILQKPGRLLRFSAHEGSNQMTSLVRIRSLNLASETLRQSFVI